MIISQWDLTCGPPRDPIAEWVWLRPGNGRQIGPSTCSSHFDIIPQSKSAHVFRGTCLRVHSPMPWTCKRGQWNALCIHYVNVIINAPSWPLNSLTIIATVVVVRIKQFWATAFVNAVTRNKWIAIWILATTLVGIGPTRSCDLTWIGWEAPKQVNIVSV